MATLTPVLRSLVTLGAAVLAGCSGYEQSCDLNPYSCSGGDTGTSDPSCGPCELDDGHGGCEPVSLVSRGECNDNETCSPDLECRNDLGQQCGKGFHCATGVCKGGECWTCATDADCAEMEDAPLCSGGWCRRPIGAPCETDVACVTNRCAVGVCAACSDGGDCASGQCAAITGVCLATAGQPCTLESECATDQCTGGRCIP